MSNGLLEMRRWSGEVNLEYPISSSCMSDNYRPSSSSSAVGASISCYRLVFREPILYVLKRGRESV